MRVAITGASGLVGTALGRALEVEGHDVVRMGRGPRESRGADWDGAGGWFRDGVFDGVTAVVHLSGASIGDGRWTDERKAALRHSRIDTTRALVAHLESLSERPEVFVCASAVGYYGDRGDENLTEGALPGRGFLAQLVADWEAEASRAQHLGIRTVMTRGGPTLASLLPKMVRPFKLGLGGPLGNGRQWFPWVALDDTVRAMQFALANDISGAVNVVSPGGVTNRQFTKALGQALRRPAVLPLPAIVLRLMFGGERANELFLSSQRVRPERLTNAGFEFDHPYIDTAIALALRRQDEAGTALD